MGRLSVKLNEKRVRDENGANGDDAIYEETEFISMLRINRIINVNTIKPN